LFEVPFNVLAATGLKTVGDLRETANETLLSLQGLGQSSVDRLRKSLGAKTLPDPRNPASIAAK
jgi:DNA-directed RNA polymerase alpha subunit